ncbi:hypothetical protein PHYSODRAFT_300527 [Phytophthora sojae]|uniref:Uncharacterized protein n=1 Tax=Phytophthora sojae (strain P6497) TaxID=1094619 RepID=G4ZEW2_PHYSP|nr:hypothetical protein PHYSODRAFT_300527 [Phytophthora sojae]EGZ17458.1 hypothetical protein PHYSODRAFT_300527 [Phytophthora sojae]|eukprot:XP_009526516.1 hypothetical protein PHYSODRAFT_300527 [Phytophthora sojae]
MARSSGPVATADSSILLSEGCWLRCSGHGRSGGLGISHSVFHPVALDDMAPAARGRFTCRHWGRYVSSSSFSTLTTPSAEQTWNDARIFILFKTANHTNYELPVLLLLSVFKVVMKAAFVSAAAHKEDIVPEEVVLTVDFFDAFYRATFMPNLSWTSLVVVLVVQFLQTVLELHDLHRRTQSILARLHKTTGVAINSTKRDLLSTLRNHFKGKYAQIFACAPPFVKAYLEKEEMCSTNLAAIGRMG